MTAKSLTTNLSPRTSLNRPKVSFNIELDNPNEEDMTLVKDADPLPIVELKPFVQKVWRRERSFAPTWERSPSVATVKSEKSEPTTVTSKRKDDETVSTLTLDTGPEDAPLSPPPRTSQSLPARLTERFLTVYVNAFEDFKTQKEHFNHVVGESCFKSKNRLHPVIDPKTKKQPEHSENIIQGFITRDDRTKTTLHEISEGDSTSRVYSCSPKAIGPEDLRRQQQIRVSGETLYQFRRALPQESSPAPSRITNTSWHAANVRHGSPASLLYQSKRGKKSKRTKTPIYDHLDRLGTLPSLSINATSLKKRQSKKQEDMHSEDYVDYSNNYDPEFRHNIGGIENSLVVLSQHGEPTKVERQISFELEKNLSRFRKLKDYSPFEINPSELAKYYPPPTFNMTQGEAQLRLAMQSNTSNHHKRKTYRSRNIHRTTFGAGGFHGMHKTSSQYTHGILKKSFHDIEHIDSFDNLYEPYSKLTNAFYTPNEEPNAPFDTPRSHAESRISSKATDARVAEQSLNKRKTNQLDTKTILNHDNQLEEVNKDTSERIKEENLAEKNANGEKGKSVVENEKTIVSNVPTVEDKSVAKKVLATNGNDKSISGKDNTQICIERDQMPQNTEPKGLKTVQIKTSQPQQLKHIDVSGRTFLTSDNVPQVGVVSS